MVIDPTDLGATTVVAPGLMLDNFVRVRVLAPGRGPAARAGRPGAATQSHESLPFYPSVLNCSCDDATQVVMVAITPDSREFKFSRRRIIESRANLKAGSVGVRLAATHGNCEHQ